MGKVLKVKRLKSSDSPKSVAVLKRKSKWEKPKKKFISSQPGIMKIKNVKKRSFDPIKANRGVVLLQNIPHGFDENGMKKYFGQFGLVTRIRLALSPKTGHSKGYAFIEFKVPEVAQIAADTMNNYIMFKHVLKTVYIPPDKQTHNYFRKDVKVTKDADGLQSFSSAKTEQIQKEIERINEPRTDEQHAKVLKRIKKSVNKQGKKYGIDLSSIMVSGNNISDETSSTSEEEPPETKIIEEVKKKSNKKAEQKPETKKVENKKVEKELKPKKEEKKLPPKKEEKKIVTKKDEKKMVTKKEEKMLGIDDETELNGKSLLGELLNSTFDTDTSDDDFKIDHSFSASDEDSSNEENLFDLLGSKLDAKFKQTKLNTFSDDVDDDASDLDDDVSESDDDASESEDESPKQSKIKKFKNAAGNATNASADNSSVNSKKKAGLKRKNKLNSEPIIKQQVAASSPPKPAIQIKKKKQNVVTKEATSTSEISTSEPEIAKITTKNKKQKPLANGGKVPNKVTSSAVPETANQKKKQKHLGDGGINSKAAISSSQPVVPNKKMKKKQGEGKVNLNMTTGSSEPETQEVKKNKQKPSADKEKPTADKGKPSEVTSSASELTSSASEPKKPNLQMKKKKKQKQTADGKIANKVTNNSEPETQIIKKKKKWAERVNLNASTSSTEPEVQNPKLKKKNNKVAADGERIPIATTNISEPEAVNMKKKKQKAAAPSVSTSQSNENGASKKDLKRKVVVDSPSGWTDLPDGDEMAKPKSKANLKLKTIVRNKNIGTLSKKSSKTNEKDAKKIKQTPADLLQLVSSKTIQSTNQLKSKKKSK